MQTFTRPAHVFLFSLILLFMSVISTSAKSSLTQISSVYFNTPNSFVVETATLNNPSPFVFEKISANNYKLSFADVALAGNMPKTLTNQDYEMQITEHKSPGRSFFRSNDIVDILINYKGAAESLELSPRELLAGFASEYQMVPLSKVAVEIPAPKQGEQAHHLAAVFQSVDLSTTQEFLGTLDQPEIKQDLSNPEFQSQISTKIDALALAQVAELLAAKGLDAKAVSAFHRVLNIDPANHQARLGLARLSTDTEEKLNNYLASIETESLLALANTWSQQVTNPEALAKALLTYQLAILKDPYNPNYRLDCARLLEAMGSPQYALAAKRYLEAAALAKNSYLSGDLNSEPLLREATESLIKVLSKQGEAELALKYCNSYLDLGFKRFTNGKPIVAVMKELKQNQNPFAQG